MQKIIKRYVCRVPVLTPTNHLFLKTDLLQLDEVFNLQIFMLMQSTLTGFDVNHKSFTPVCSVYSDGTRFSKQISFVIKTLKTKRGQNCLR